MKRLRSTAPGYRRVRQHGGLLKLTLGSPCAILLPTSEAASAPRSTPMASGGVIILAEVSRAG